jgi:hypothetical protein
MILFNFILGRKSSGQQLKGRNSSLDGPGTWKELDLLQKQPFANYWEN